MEFHTNSLSKPIADGFRRSIYLPDICPPRECPTMCNLLISNPLSKASNRMDATIWPTWNTQHMNKISIATQAISYRYWMRNCFQEVVTVRFVGVVKNNNIMLVACKKCFNNESRVVEYGRLKIPMYVNHSWSTTVKLLMLKNLIKLGVVVDLSVSVVAPIDKVDFDLYLRCV